MKIGIILAGVLVFCGFAQAAERTVKVLAVGNSFSQNALTYFTNIVTASGNSTVAVNAMIGGCDFERHMRHADAFEVNPADIEGRPYPGGLSLKDLLTQEKWDVITIQQASPKSYKPETFHPHADRLIAYIKKYAPQAEIVIHQTWAYREDHPFWGETNMTTDLMYKGLRAAYDGFAKETGFRQIPCGDAFESARQDPAWGKFVPDLSYDRQKAVYPALPKEKNSLHNPCWWKTKNTKSGGPELLDDRFHANAQGKYLQGCVWFEFFFGQSAVGNAFIPAEVSEQEAAVLQRIAHRVVTEKQRPVPMP
jgi:hypothetical protein